MIRPTRTVTVTQRVSATRSVKHDLTLYTDTTAFDAMHHYAQLSDRQHDAACRLYRYFFAAGLAASATMRMDTLSEGCEPMDIESADMEPEEAKLAYRRILRDSGPISGPLLDALMHGQHPGRRLEALQDALGVLADGWGME